MPIVADAAVAVRADMARFGSDLKTGTDKPIKSLGQRIKGAFSPAAIAGGAAALGGVLVAGLVGAAKALIDIERLNAQTDAAIRSTKGVANVTREGVEELAEGMEDLTTIEREVVQEGANMLLTFTNVRNELGDGNDIFDQATEKALDMSVALGTDATSAAMLLGKALNDPVKGMTAMTRAGIQFTDQQKGMIKAMVEAGDLLGAQKIILAELETQFGGSAEAFAGTTAGKIQRFQNDIGNFFEGIMVGAVEVKDTFADLTRVQDLSMAALAINFGDQGDRIHDLADDIGISFDTLKNRVLTRMLETGEGTEEALAAIEGHWNATSSEVVTIAGGMPEGAAAAIEAGEPVVTTAADVALSQPLIVAMLGGQAEAERIAGETPGGIAQALIDNQFSVEGAAASLAAAIENALHPMIERAQIIAFLASGELAAGLASGIPAVRARALELKEAAETRLAELEGAAFGFGQRTGFEYAAGIINSLGVVADAGRQLGGAVGNQISIESEPPDHSSPLYGITKWGGNIVKTIAGGINSELGLGTNAARNLAGSLVPGFAGVGMAPSVSRAGPAPGVGNQYHVHLEDRLQVRTVTDIGNALRRLGEAGLLPGSLTPK